MAHVVIKDFEEHDARLMAQSMRPMDRLEYRVMAQGAPIEAGMLHMRAVSDLAKAAYVDGKLLCCWGRIRKTILSGECCPWMVATPLIDDRTARRIFIQRSPKIIDDLTGGFNRAWNMVYEGNKVTIRWLKWAGFKFVGEPLVVDGYKFLPFEKGNTDVR